MKPCILRTHDARVPLGALLAVASGGIVPALPAWAADISGNATLTTDYVWRGSTQTQGGPAAQVGVKVAGRAGFYASAWGSNVRFAPETGATAEFDFSLGWGKPLDDDWAVDVNVLRYQYPSAALDLNWSELNGTLTYRDRYWVAIGHSNQALGDDASGTYAQVGARFPINDNVGIEASVGHYALSRAVVAGSGYSHAQLSAVWAFKAPFALRVTAHATDSRAKAIFGDDHAGRRIEAALQASF